MPVEFLMCIILAAISGLGLAMAFSQSRERQKILRLAGIEKTRGGTTPLWEHIRPISKQVYPLIRRAGLARDASRIEQFIISSGLEDVLDAPSFCTARVIVTILGVAAAILLFKWPIVFKIATGGACGWFLITVWLKTKATKRQRVIEKELPGVLDWLALSVEAGLDFTQAMGRVVGRLKASPLRDELSRFESHVRMGAPRRRALSELSQRVGVPSLSSFVALLVQADILGASIGPVLHTSAQRLRADRFSNAERKGSAATQKALLPLAFCIMPTTFIVIFGPLIVRVVTGGLKALF